MRVYEVTMPDGSQWNVPVDAIARSHAQYYAAYETAGDIETCFREHSLPLLMADMAELRDWASGNMNWSDVAGVAFPAAPKNAPTADEYQEGWVNGYYRVRDIVAPAPAEALPDGWVRTDVQLPDPVKVAPCRRGVVEVGGKDSSGAWCFSQLPAHTVAHVEQYCLVWRYLPPAPAA
jgi:hypothetical protein